MKRKNKIIELEKQVESLTKELSETKSKYQSLFQSMKDIINSHETVTIRPFHFQSDREDMILLDPSEIGEFGDEIYTSMFYSYRPLPIYPFSIGICISELDEGNIIVDYLPDTNITLYKSMSHVGEHCYRMITQRRIRPLNVNQVTSYIEHQKIEVDGVLEDKVLALLGSNHIVISKVRNTIEIIYLRSKKHEDGKHYRRIIGRHGSYFTEERVISHIRRIDRTQRVHVYKNSINLDGEDDRTLLQKLKDEIRR